MGPRGNRSLLLSIACLAPLWIGADCEPSPGARFSPGTGVLSVYGGPEADTLVVSRTATSTIVVNGGLLPIEGGVPTAANTVRIEIHGRAGDDYLALDEAMGALPAALLFGGLGDDDLRGGSGNDSLDGGDGADALESRLGSDVVRGGEGGDLVNGGDGEDLALLGGGDDTFVWNLGDDPDTVEGEAGFDILLFHGNGAPENIDIAAVGERVRFFRDVAAVTLDLDDVEAIDFEAAGSTDVVVVNDLSGTDLVELNLDLAALGGGGDLAPDTVLVKGTEGDDAVLVVGDAGGVSLLGLAAQVNLAGAESANDRLTVHALGGADVVDASGLAATGTGLGADGGVGDDVLLGSDGNDVLLGGEGDDVLLGGPGVDVLDGGLGDDIEIQD